MVESERRRLITSTPHISPEEVLQRTFPTSFRGFAEADVRAFMKRISEALVLTRDREAELLEVIDSLEEQLRSPRALSEPELLEALGAETARLLRSARDTADEIRVNAEERVARLAEEARVEAERLAAELEEEIRARSEEATARAVELVSEAEGRASDIESAMEAYAAEQRSRAERETEELIESARAQGREMLDEARATRERVLSDLLRRRSLLQAQIDELRGGRDHLIDAYRVVKRTFLEATEALAQVEARAAAERAAPTTDTSVADGEELDASDAIDASDAGDGDAAGDDTPGIAVETAEGEPASVTGAGSPDDGEKTDPSLADVESLFARIRAGQTEAAIAGADEHPGGAESNGHVAGATHAAEAGVSAPATGAADAEAGGSEVATGAVVDLTGPEAPETAVTDPGTAGATVPEPSEPLASESISSESISSGLGPPSARSAAVAWRARRAEVVDPLLARLAKRAKRAAQDDQNALLDAVRRHKGRPNAAQVLTPEADLLSEWVSVIRDAIDEAYAAGRVAVGGSPTSADDALASEAAVAIVLPLRERITAAIDAGEEGDTGGLVERIGARFREWKNQSLEGVLADELAMAWSRGVYDATPDGAVLHWVPLVEGRCADCDDNGLEPTIKGSSFPTGQAHPPAHPGCRCLLLPSEVLGRLATNA